MPPGVLWVSSRISPSATSNPNPLTPDKFCSWYENTHIQEVTSLPGVPRAARYEAISPQPSEKTWSTLAPWLTVYEMPEIEYRETKEFKGLDGQSRPREELLQGVFKQARFDTRFYEQVQLYEPSSTTAKSGPAKFLISAALQPKAGEDENFDAWYREEHLRVLSECEGFRRSRRFKVVNATALDEFKRIEPEVPKYLALHEFDGEGFPWEGLQKSAETEWASKVMGSLALEEIGWYRLKRTYE